MEHVAIMKKSWGLTQKILSGQKTVESRWFKFKSAPWDRISQGEIIYFKDSGSLVSVKAVVDKVVQISDLTSDKVTTILNEYSADLGISDVSGFCELFKDKKYCILIFLKKPESIEPFDIDKSGFGSMSAWICVDNVEKIKKTAFP